MMQLEIIEQGYNKTLYGTAGLAVNQNFAQTGMKLMDEMWTKIRKNNLKHKGINVWVYEEGDKLFTGVEMETVPTPSAGLELKQVNLKRYAYYKYVGSYQQLPAVYTQIRAAIATQALNTCYPWLEVYGHWSADESKMETEIFICLK